MTMCKREKEIWMMAGRMLVYTAVLVLSVLMLWKIAAVEGSDAMWEEGSVENIQLGLLGATALVFGAEAWRFREWRPVLMLLSALSLAAGIRECDYMFDQLIPVISWKFCYLFVLASLAYMWKHREQTRRLLAEFFCSSTFFLCICAVIILIPAAQCVGHRAFINNAVGIDDMGLSILIRRTFEESLELLAYLLLLLASLEFYFSQPRKKEAAPRE